MKTLIAKRRLIALIAGLFGAVIATSALVSYWTSTARATGIPTTNPLYYSGLLEDTSGKMLTGSKSIGIDLYDALSGGNKKCSTAAAATTLTQGRFRIALDSGCVKAIQDTADLWVEVTVGGTSMGRTKIGAVPYAVEAKRVEEPDCPPGYTKDSTVTSFTLCKKGSDQMVKVGDSWADRYKMSIVDSTTWDSGKCDGSGTQYGAGTTDDYPSTFPDSGNWSAKLYGCSISGVAPSRSMTWFQAQQACLLAGKHLCTNGEWQAAAAGTSDPGSYDGTSGGACHTNGSAVRNTGNAGSTPGASSSCISRWGAEDTVGNLWEWVDLWGQAGMSWMSSSGDTASPWPSTGGYGDGSDLTWNLDGRASNGSAWTSGTPAAALRGGGWGNKTDAGVFSMRLLAGPAYWATDVGARCCRQ
jgi:formylglycine-generating enzyme required for sulfatase activity